MNCELCGREAETTSHHLVPRSRKRQQSEDFGPTAELCRDCHRKIHATWDNKTIGQKYNTIELLLEAEEMQEYLNWIKKQPGTAYFGSTRTKGRRKGKYS